jgi:hypothetical protein
MRSRCSGPRRGPWARGCAGCPTARPANVPAGWPGRQRPFALVTDTEEYSGIPVYRLRGQVPDAESAFGALGYADAALASYQTFVRLKADGTVPAGIRFQVSLPTPVAVVAAFVAPQDRVEAELQYTRALDRELETILAAVPADQLAIQWDVAVEFGILEGAAFGAWWDDPKAAILGRLAALGNRVPDGVELGFHLCYGDAAHEHFVQPRDTGLLVEVANDLIEGIDRQIDFLHLPVPRDRTDAAYFAPLADLRRPDGTALFLGLVHQTDGLGGATARVAAARRFVDGFGVATECGFGRRPAESVEPLLELHRSIIDAPLSTGLSTGQLS